MNGSVKLALSLGIFVAFSTHCAFAQKQATGTIIAFGISNQFITVAADSKMIEVNTGNAKTACKITTLSDKSVFAVTGMNFLQSISRPELRWDANGEAKRAYNVVRSSGGIHANPEFLNAVANQWVTTSRAKFTQMTTTDAAWFWRQVKDTHIRAFFGGFDETGKIGVADARLDLIQQHGTISGNVDSYAEGETPIFFAIGETQIASEFILLKSDSAKKEYAVWQHSVRGKSPIQQASLRTIDLVCLSIRYLPAQDAVGPPIHAVTLQSKGTIEWVPGMRCR